MSNYADQLRALSPNSKGEGTATQLIMESDLPDEVKSGLMKDQEKFTNPEKVYASLYKLLVDRYAHRDSVNQILKDALYTCKSVLPKKDAEEVSKKRNELLGLLAKKTAALSATFVEYNLPGLKQAEIWLDGGRVSLNLGIEKGLTWTLLTEESLLKAWADKRSTDIKTDIYKIEWLLKKWIELHNHYFDLEDLEDILNSTSVE